MGCISKNNLNKLLLALLGSEILVEQWWLGRNKAFNMETPETVYATNPKLVQDYIMGFCI